MSTFDLKPEHIKLLRAMAWRSSEDYQPVPQVDAKRPFGFSHSYEDDAAETVGVTPQGGTDDYGGVRLTEEQTEAMQELIEESLTALMVILDAADRLPTGTYYRSGDGPWRFGNTRNHK
jgi:hypothetical protein